MDVNIDKMNAYLVSVFNDILTIEESALKKSQFSDLSIKEMHTIEAIGLHKELTSTEVANSLAITVGTLTVAINNLEKKGYVERIRSEKDRRIVRLKLTNRGRLFYRIHERFHQNMVASALVGMGKEEQQSLMKGLKNLHSFLNEDEEEK